MCVSGIPNEDNSTKINKLDIQAIMWHCLHDDMFSSFVRTPTCDGQTQTNTHTATCSI